MTHRDDLAPVVVGRVRKAEDERLERVGRIVRDVRRERAEAVQEFKERLLSDKALSAAADAYQRFEGLDKVLEAAIAAAESGGDQ